MHEHINELAHKEVTRKEFLTIAVVGFSSLFGISTIISLLSGKHPSFKQIGHGSGYGYSSSVYGGRRST